MFFMHPGISFPKARTSPAGNRIWPRNSNYIQRDSGLGFQIAYPAWVRPPVRPEKMKNHLLVNLLLGFVLLIIAPLRPVFAQTPPARIDVIVVAGDGVTDNIRERVTRDPVVRVQDDDKHPIDGAVITFALPVSGTSGEFADGSKTLMVVTGKDGLATAHGLKTNDIPGNLQIYVLASYQGLRGRALINQLVEVPPGTTFATPEIHTAKSSSKLKWILLGVAAAGGAGAALYLLRHSSSSPSPSVSISAGTVVFGNP